VTRFEKCGRQFERKPAALNDLEQFLVVGVNLHVVGLGTEVLVRPFRFGMSSSRTAVLVFDD